MSQTLFSISLQNTKKTYILEKIETSVQTRSAFVHVVSLNPEIIVMSEQDEEYKKLLQSAEVHILDGVGVALLARLRGIKNAQKVTGVDLMQDIIAHMAARRLRAMFLGGGAGLAEKVAECYRQRYSQGVYLGVQGLADIRKDDISDEEDEVFRQIRAFNPDIIFAAFGSPHQEKWFWNHRKQLTGIVCMGVGGAFDFVAGTVPRAPGFMRALGLEWLFRLVRQPWRWRRQMRLITFVRLAVREIFRR